MLTKFRLELAAELDDGKGIAKTVAGITDGMGVTPLHLASLGGRMDLCKYLISDLNVDVDAKEDQGGIHFTCTYYCVLIFVLVSSFDFL